MAIFFRHIFVLLGVLLSSEAAWILTNSSFANSSDTSSNTSSLVPSGSPSRHPVTEPTPSPSYFPTSAAPTSSPTFAWESWILYVPTSLPTSRPSRWPTYNPTQPTSIPTAMPTFSPSFTPSSIPTSFYARFHRENPFSSYDEQSTWLKAGEVLGLLSAPFAIILIYKHTCGRGAPAPIENIAHGIRKGDLSSLQCSSKGCGNDDNSSIHSECSETALVRDQDNGGRSDHWAWGRFDSYSIYFCLVNK